MSLRKDPVSWLYPAIEPYKAQRLKVSELHELYIGESGNPDGKPGIFLLRQREVDWLYQEGATSKLIPDPDFIASYGDEATTLAFARIECHYFLNKGWMKEAQLLRDATKLKGIPGAIVQGRYDMVCPIESAWALANAWPDADLIIVPDAGQAPTNPAFRGRWWQRRTGFRDKKLGHC